MNWAPAARISAIRSSIVTADFELVAESPQITGSATTKELTIRGALF